jgi:hypothetical protein
MQPRAVEDPGGCVADRAGDLRKLLHPLLRDYRSKVGPAELPRILSEARTTPQSRMALIAKSIDTAEKRIEDFFFATDHSI